MSCKSARNAVAVVQVIEYKFTTGNEDPTVGDVLEKVSGVLGIDGRMFEIRSSTIPTSGDPDKRGHDLIA